MLVNAPNIIKHARDSINNAPANFFNRSTGVPVTAIRIDFDRVPKNSLIVVGSSLRDVNVRFF